MEKLTRQELELLLELLKKEKESIHQKAIHDAGARERELDIDFIKIKLDAELKHIEG